MDIVDIIIARKLAGGGGGGGFPLGVANSEYKLSDLGLTWENTAEENE